MLIIVEGWTPVTEILESLGFLTHLADVVIVKRSVAIINRLVLKVVHEECEGKLGPFPIGA